MAKRIYDGARRKHEFRKKKMTGKITYTKRTGNQEYSSHVISETNAKESDGKKRTDETCTLSKNRD